jgi:hypothetical protein
MKVKAVKVITHEDQKHIVDLFDKLLLNDPWFTEYTKFVKNLRTNKIHKVLYVSKHKTIKTTVIVNPPSSFSQECTITLGVLKVESQEEININDLLIEIKYETNKKQNNP